MRKKFMLLVTSLCMGMASWAQAPDADLLDVVFNSDGTAQDVSAMANPITSVGHPVVKMSSKLGINEMCAAKADWSSTPSAYYRVDYATNSALMDAMKDGFSMETYVRSYWIDNIRDAECKPFSSHQGGGMGIMVSSSSRTGQNEWTFLPYTGGTYRWAMSSVVPTVGEYVHIVGVWDANEKKAHIYVNGELASSVDAPTPLSFPSSGSQWFCIGGDPDGANAASNAFQGDIALARVYSHILTPEQVAATYEAAKALDTGNDEHAEEQEEEVPYLSLAASGNQMEITQTGDYEWNIKTLGGDPYVSVSSLQHDLTADQSFVCFEYTSTMNLDCEFFFSPIAAGREQKFVLPAATEYTKMYVDIASSKETFNWGRRGDNLRFDCGTVADAEVNIRNIKIATREEYLGTLEQVEVTMEKDADGYYLITNATQLREFSVLVNNGDHQLKGKLTSNIDMSGMDNFPPIGWGMLAELCRGGEAISNTGFAGEFDGQGYEIQNLTAMKDPRFASTGVFGIVTGKVKNLGVTGYSSEPIVEGRHAALAGLVLEGTLQNCYVIQSSVKRGNEIVAIVAGGNYGGTIESCFEFNNTLENHSRAGHLVGDAKDDNGVRIGAETNCYSDGRVTGDYTSDVVNCGSNFDAGMFASGEVAFKLNGDQSEIAFYQTIGTDAYPVLDKTHGRVYAKGEFNCNGSAKPGSNIEYTNTQSDAVIPPHQYEDGVCVNCGAEDPALMKQDEEGYYLIANAAQLCRFASMINNVKTNLNAKLIADIDLGGVDNFTPIGLYSDTNGTKKSFAGIFDGQGHIVYNLKVSSDEAFELGLFSRATTATVRNLGVVNATVVSNANVRVGVLFGECHASDVTNCFTAGDIVLETSHDQRGGFAGEAYESNLTNVYSTYNGPLVNNTSKSRVNCFGGAEVAEIAATGELCFKLNNGTFLNPTWYQTLGEDMYPVLDKTHGLVYQKGENEYADMHDDESFASFRDDVVALESDYANDVIAQAELVETFESAIAELSEITSFADFLQAYLLVSELREVVEECADAYAAYMDKVAYAANYLEENPELGGADRDVLEAYLTENAEPSETYPNGTYAYILETRLLEAEDIKAETTFLDNLINEAIKNGYVPGSDITNLLVNADFSDGRNGWDITSGSITVAATGNDQVPYMAYSSNLLNISQTLEGMQNGIYLMSLYGDYRPYSINNSLNYGSYVYMNDGVNYLDVLRDDLLPYTGEEDEEFLANGNQDLVTNEDGEELGWGPKGVAGHGVYYGMGRYQNFCAVRVTDGTLTLGVRTPGFGGVNNTNLANVHLTYLGNAENTQSADALKEVLQDMSSHAQFILNSYYYDDGNDYAKAPNFSDAYRNELMAELADADALGDDATGTQVYEIIERMSDTFKSIYDCKIAYTRMLDVIEEIFGVYNSQSGDEESEETKAVNDLYQRGWDGYYGSLTTEEAKEITEACNKYRWDGLYPVPSTAHNITCETVGPYEFLLTSFDGDPYISTSALTEDLADDQIVFAFDYKSATAHRAEIFFSPYTGGHETWFNIEVCDDWTPIYLDIAQERYDWNWGAKGGTLRLDIIPDGECQLYVRRLRIITRDQMEAEINGQEDAIVAPTEDKAPATRGTYDLSGRHVSKKLSKGIYIQDGKKLLVK